MMKPSTYIKNYLLYDIILLLIISGFVYLAVNAWNKNKIENKTTVELVPYNIGPNDAIGKTDLEDVINDAIII